MSNIFHQLLTWTPRQKQQENIKEKTNEALEDLQRSLSEYQHKSRKDRAKIIKILTTSEQELNSVAAKIAVATGRHRRTP